MNRTLRVVAGLSTALLLAVVATELKASVLYSQNFNTDVSASWTTTQGPGTNVATFAYDYSALGIPPAPGSSGTLGLRLQANTTGVTTAQALTGLSTSPNGQSFSGDYRMTLYSWQNYGGSGTTMLSTYTIGAVGDTAQRPGGTIQGIMFGATSDGGSASDYRAYDPGSDGTQILTAGTYAAGGQNNTAAYYSTVFPGAALSPAVQGPVLGSPAGTPAFTWQRVDIKKQGNIVTWLLNRKLIATVNLALVDPILGTNIALGQSDINNTGPTNPNLVFGLVDNLVVVAIPEPTSLLLLGIAGIGMLARRSR